MKPETVKIERNEIYNVINAFDKDDHFKLTFTKKDGTVRSYDDCQVHIYFESTGHRHSKLTAKESFEKHNNLVFYKNGEEPGYRTAKIDNIISFELNDKIFEVI